MIKQDEELEKNRRLFAWDVYINRLERILELIKLLKEMNATELIDLKLKTDYEFYEMILKKAKEEKLLLIKNNIN